MVSNHATPPHVARRRRRTLLLVALLAVGAATGCTTVDDAPAPEPDLDVAMPVNARPTAPLGEGAVAYVDIVPTKQAAGADGKIPASAVMNWQAFFKGPPGAKDRSLLERKLSAWKDDASPKELLAKGRDELAVGRMVFAETSFRKALRLDPRNLDAELELASLYLRKKDVLKAFEFLSQVKEGINTADTVGQSFIFRYRYTLALAYIARGDREKGHKVLSDLIGVEKSFAPAYAALAGSYMEMGRNGVATFVVRRGLDRAKDDAVLLNLMGVLTQKDRQPDAARTWFDKALVVSPNYAPALVNRANLSLQGFEFAAAEEDLKRALAIDPLSVDALVALGITQKKQGNVSGAKASLSKAVDVAPDNAYARFNLGVLMADDLKRPNEALRLFHEVLQTPAPGDDVKELARSYINDLKQTGASY